MTRGSGGKMEVRTAEGEIAAVIPLKEEREWKESEEALLVGLCGRQALFFVYRGTEP